MTIFEMALIVIALVAIIWGAIRGLVRQLGAVAGIVLGVIACRVWGAAVAAWLSGFAESGASKASLQVLAYVLLFLAVYLCCYIIGWLARKTLEKLKLGIADRIGGALLKLFIWMFLLSLVLNLWRAVLPAHAPDGPWAERVEWLAPAVLGSDTAAELMQSLKKQAN